MLTLALLSFAHAGDLPEYVDVELPPFNVQLFRPAIDARRTLWTDESGGLIRKPRLGVQVSTNLVGDPFVVYWTDANGDKGASSVVGTGLQFHVQPALSVRRFRAALDLPVWAFATSEVTSGGGGLGDGAVDLRYNLLDRESMPVGLSVSGRVDLPTSTVPTTLGIARPGIGWELSTAVDRDLGPLRLAGNVGTRGVPRAEASHQEDPTLTWDDQFLFRVAGSYVLDINTGVSLEMAGAATYAQLGAGERRANGGFPVEVMAGGWRRLGSDLTLRAGLGAGLTGGVGAARYRAVVSLAWDPAPIGGYPKEHDPVLVEVRWGTGPSAASRVSVGPGARGVEITVDPDGNPRVTVLTGGTPAPELTAWLPADAPVIAFRDDLVRVNAASGGPPIHLEVRHLGDGRVEIVSGESVGQLDLVYADDPVDIDLRVRWGQTPRKDVLTELPTPAPRVAPSRPADSAPVTDAGGEDARGLRGLPGYDPEWTAARAGWEERVARDTGTVTRAAPVAEDVPGGEPPPLRGLPGDDPEQALERERARKEAFAAAEREARAAGAPAAPTTADPTVIFEDQPLRGLPGRDPLDTSPPTERVRTPAPTSDVPFEEFGPVVEAPLKGLPGTPGGSKSKSESVAAPEADPYAIFRDEPVRGMPGTSSARATDPEPAKTVASVGGYKPPSKLPSHLVEAYLRDTPHVLFAVDDFAVPLADRERLEAVAASLKGSSDRVRVVGHADGREINVTELADQRARAVRDLLVRSGVAAGRIEILVLAADAPIDARENEAGFRSNRRVDVVIGER